MKVKKENILWQSTVVKFRNGLLGLAINDKINEDCKDGNEQFVVFNPDRTFHSIQFLNNYNDELKNTLSVKGIMEKIEATETKSYTECLNDVELADSEWDVVDMMVYPYASNAFRKLFEAR